MNYVWGFLFSALYSAVLIVAFLYVSIPFLIKFIPSVVLQGTFLNLICSPRRFSRLHKPKEAWKLDGVKHHYLRSNSGKLGVWHLFPTTENALTYPTGAGLSEAEKIIVYCHGNTWHRSFGHRRSLYALLRSHGFHVITFDYRGYGDSDGWPSEKGVIEDTITVYKWVVDQVEARDCKIFVWGHSLGTAIATQAVHKIEVCEHTRPPSGLILEAPFTSAVDAMTEYPLSKNLAKLYPGNWMQKLFEKALSSTQIYFSTVNFLPKLNSNVLILHAQDDKKVHFKLGRKLFDETRKNQESCLNIVFVSFKASHGFGHNGIWQHPEILNLVDNLSLEFESDRFIEIEL